MDDLKNKILIVDDEVDFCLSLQDVLESRNYRVALAYTIDEGLAQLETFDPDLALMDIRLGRENGIDLLRSFREIDEHILCIMMTAYADTETAIEALKGGAYDYLRKPVSPDDLFATVSRCFERLALSEGKVSAENQLQRRNAELTRLNQQLSGMVAAAAVLASHQNDDLLPRYILDTFFQNLSAEAGCFYALRNGDLFLEYAIPENSVPNRVTMAEMSPSSVLSVVSDRTPIVLPQGIHGDEVFTDAWSVYRHGSSLIFPIAPPTGEVLGIVILYRSKGISFTERDLELGLVFASLSGEVILAKNAAEKFRTVVDTSNDAIVGADSSLKINLFNSSAEKMFGYSKQEAVGQPMFILVPNRGREGFATTMAIAAEKGVDPEQARAISVIGRRKDGSVFPAELSWSVKNPGGDIAYYAIVRDMTERRLSERAVRESEHRYHTLFESAGDAILLIDGERISDCNEKALDLFGCSRDDLIGSTIADFSPPIQVSGESTQTAAQRYLSAAYSEHQFFEWRHKQLNGYEFDVEVSLTVLFLDGRQLILAILRDVSLQKRMVRNLKASEERYSAIVRAVPSGIATLRKSDLVYLSVNDAWESIYQKKKEHVIGESIYDLKLVEHEDMERVLAGIERVGEVDGYPAVLNLPDGACKSILVSARPVNLNEEQCILAVTLDVTEIEEARKRENEQEQQLFQAAKMVSLGTLVSGVAHEINNPNNFIRLSSENLYDFWGDIDFLLQKSGENGNNVLLKGIPLDTARDMIAKMFEGIAEGTKRIEKLILSLKDFSRKDDGERGERFDINAAVETSVSLTASVIRRSTENFSTNLSDNLPEIAGNYHQIEQIVINLITNACQSLTKRTQSIEVITDYDSETDMVKVMVVDQGVGIPEENLMRVTDPFFTTKRDVGGTGLGLSVSYRIAQNHGGNIIFKSSNGTGTEATLILPATAEV